MENTLILKNLTDEQVKLLEEISINKESVIALKEGESFFVVPSDNKEAEKVIGQAFGKLERNNLEKGLEDSVTNFMDTYAIVMKNEKVEIPHAVKFLIGSEYNDETYDPCVETVLFYNKNLEPYNIDIEVEYEGYEEDFQYALRMEVEQKHSAAKIEKYLEDRFIYIK